MERDDAGEKDFEWDEDKAEVNRKKHGVTFKEAATVFQDPLSLTIHDPRHSWGEIRNLHIGLSTAGRLLRVVYTEEGSTIRLISSREATREERRIYEEGTYHDPLTEDAKILPEYDLSGGVRGKYARAFREGYTVKVHHKDGTTEMRREEVTSLFRDYGYLSGQAQKNAVEMEAKHADYFELFYRASSFAQRLLLDLRLPSGDIQKLVVAGLMARLLEDSQGCALLVKHGIAKTTAVTLRTSFECLVLLKSCCTERDFADRFAASDTLEFLRLTRAAQGNPELNEKQREELKLREDELDLEKKAYNIQRLPPIEKLARNAGMDRYYQTIYRLTSGHTHISPRSLKSYYSFSGGKAGEIAFGPNDDSTALYLYTLSDFLLIGTGLTSQLFDLDRNRLGMEIREEHKKLSPKQPDESDE